MEFKKGDKVLLYGKECKVEEEKVKHGVFEDELLLVTEISNSNTLQAPNEHARMRKDGTLVWWKKEPIIELIECGEHNHEWDNLQRTYTSGYCKRCKKTIRVEQPEKKKVTNQVITILNDESKMNITNGYKFVGEDDEDNDYKNLSIDLPEEIQHEDVIAVVIFKKNK
jgi:hypothetical protein